MCAIKDGFFRIVKKNEDGSYILEIHDREVCPRNSAIIKRSENDCVIVEVKKKAQITIGGYEYVWDADAESLIPFC